MVDITKTVEIGTGPGEVFSAVTTQEGLRGWWTRQAIAEPRAGHVNQFPFSSGDFNAMRVVALEPDHRVEWECVEGADEWVGTRVMFDIAPAEGGTVLTFTHADWEADTPFFRMCRKAWEWYMASLKQFCETGSGTPS